jgi:DNA primase
MAMLQYPESVGDELLRRAAEVRFGNESLRVVRDALVASLPATADWIDRVVEQVPEGFVPLARELAAAPIPTQPDRLAAYCESVVADLVVRDLLRRRGELVGAMQRAQAEGDRERWAALSRQSAELEMERRRLRRE